MARAKRPGLLGRMHVNVGWDLTRWRRGPWVQVTDTERGRRGSTWFGGRRYPFQRRGRS